MGGKKKKRAILEQMGGGLKRKVGDTHDKILYLKDYPFETYYICKSYFSKNLKPNEELRKINQDELNIVASWYYDRGLRLKREVAEKIKQYSLKRDSVRKKVRKKNINIATAYGKQYKLHKAITVYFSKREMDKIDSIKNLEVRELAFELMSIMKFECSADRYRDGIDISLRTKLTPFRMNYNKYHDLYWDESKFEKYHPLIMEIGLIKKTAKWSRCDKEEWYVDFDENWFDKEGDKELEVVCHWDLRAYYLKYFDFLDSWYECPICKKLYSKSHRGKLYCDRCNITQKEKIVDYLEEFFNMKEDK